jgi:hypothetical protein
MQLDDDYIYQKKDFKGCRNLLLFLLLGAVIFFGTLIFIVYKLTT